MFFTSDYFQYYMQSKKPSFHKLHYESNSSDAYEGIQLDTQNLNFLESSKETMKGWVGDLGETSETPLLEWVQKYVGKMKIDNLTGATVLTLIDKRVEKMKKNKKIKKNWGAEDAQILVWAVSKYCQSNRINKLDDMTVIDWDFISSNIPGSQSRDCLFKWLTLKKTKLSECQWSEEESDNLRRLVENYGEDEWKQVSLKLYEKNQNKKKKFRNPKQCKERWLSFLNPDKKTGPWSKQQDRKLLEWVYEKKGEKKWSEIRKNFSGRTQNAMKNRYNLLIEKQVKATSQTENEKDELKLILIALKNMGVKVGSKEHFNPIQNIKSEEEQFELLKQNSSNGSENRSETNGVPPDTDKRMKDAEGIRVIASSEQYLREMAEKCGYAPVFYPAIIYPNQKIYILKSEQIE